MIATAAKVRIWQGARDNVCIEPRGETLHVMWYMQAYPLQLCDPPSHRIPNCCLSCTQGGYHTNPIMPMLLAACPNLGSLTLVLGSPRTNRVPRHPKHDPHTAVTHTQLHTLRLEGCDATWQLPQLPSLTALLLDGKQWHRS